LVCFARELFDLAALLVGAIAVEEEAAMSEERLLDATPELG